MSAIAIADRRSPNRLVTPTCPFCGTDRFVAGVIRTATFVFFRCRGCRDRELLPLVIPSASLSGWVRMHAPEVCVSEDSGVS